MQCHILAIKGTETFKEVPPSPRRLSNFQPLLRGAWTCDVLMHQFVDDCLRCLLYDKADGIECHSEAILQGFVRVTSSHVTQGDSYLEAIPIPYQLGSCSDFAGSCVDVLQLWNQCCPCGSGDRSVTASSHHAPGQTS